METGYPDWGFSWFSLFIQANAGIVPYTRLTPLPYISFSIHYSPIILSSGL
jgi:hypothetical protein